MARRNSLRAVSKSQFRSGCGACAICGVRILLDQFSLMQLLCNREFRLRIDGLPRAFERSPKRVTIRRILRLPLHGRPE